MNSLYIAVALVLFGEGLISIFVPIYLWQLGFPIWRILFFYFLQSIFFILVSLTLLPLLRKLSDKTMMFWSIPFVMGYFIGLPFIVEQPFLFYLLPFMIALNLLLFNVGYHLCFTVVVDKDHIGQEVGARHFIGSLARFSAPFLGGLLIGVTSFRIAFFVGGFILLAAVVPLLFFPHRKFSQHLHYRQLLSFLTDKTMKPFTISGIGYANEVIIGGIIWPLFIFLSLGSIERFGGVVSIGLLAGVVVTYFVGSLADVGMRRKVLTLGTLLFAGAWVARAMSRSVSFIVGSHIVGNVIYPSFLVSWSSQYYKISRAINHTSLFILSRELLYNMARAVFIPVLMVLAYVMPQEIFFRISFAMAIVWTLMFLYANKLHVKDLPQEVHHTI